MSEVQSWPKMLELLLNAEDLSTAESSWAMGEIISGRVSDVHLAAFLVALRAKGETVEEVTGFRDSALEHAKPTRLPSRGVDIVGTGGDMIGTVNVSTMASFVISATGIPVLKHGGRAASAKSGAVDVLSALGAVHSNDTDSIQFLFEQTGQAFLSAVLFHPGFRHAAAVRKELGTPTVFNLLGPLSNPARPQASAIGVALEQAIPIIVGVLHKLGSNALVFRGDDGLDELTVTGASKIWEVSSGRVTQHSVHPKDVGLGTYELSQLLGGTPEFNAMIARETLNGKRTGAVRDIVLLNAAAGMVAFDLATAPESMKEPIQNRLADKIKLAAQAIDSGAVADQLDTFVAVSQSISNQSGVSNNDLSFNNPNKK